MANNSSSSHQSTGKKVSTEGQLLCDICQQSHRGAACSIIGFVGKQISQFSNKGIIRDKILQEPKDRRSKTMPRVQPTTEGVFFLDSRSENARDRRSHDSPGILAVETAVGRHQQPHGGIARDEIFRDREDQQGKNVPRVQPTTEESVGYPSWSGGPRKPQTRGLYGHYNTQYDMNPKARKHSRSEYRTREALTTEGGSNDALSVPMKISHDR
ncbi:hypothetical protein Dimus_036919, partial [Dionaea muscipula]